GYLGQSQPLQKLVDGTIVVMQHEVPQQRQDEGRDQQGHQHQAADDVLPLKVSIPKGSQTKTDAQLHNETDHGDLKGSQQSYQEGRVVEHPAVIIEPDKPRRTDQSPLVERVVN